MMSLNPTQQKVKCFGVRVTTMDADLEFRIEQDALGRDLFDLVCRTIGLRELWYFGLQYTSSKGYFLWLQMNKKVLKQDVKLTDGAAHFIFLVKFYPECAEEELIQDVTSHLFFLQVKQSILSADVYCPPEASVLLATYAVQAKHGDCDESTMKDGMLQLEELLPQRVIEQYQMTTEMWEDRIRTWWANNRGLSREDAELEYLKIAQDLNMYGVHYFVIRNKKHSDLWLGVSSHGVNIYEKDNKLVPKTCFQWSEIKNISFKDKKFNIKTMDGSTTLFWSENMAVNQVILDLCIGTHALYLRRRQPDSLEVQQMKAQAKEERLRRHAERVRLEREKALRTDLERERDRLKMDVGQLQEQLKATQEMMNRTEETAELLAEKAKVSEEEALVLAKRASETEAEIQRIKISAIKTEEAKIMMERKAREAELIASRMLEESEKRTKEAERLKNDLIRARQAENIAKDKLRELTGAYGSPINYNGYEDQNSYPVQFSGGSNDSNRMFTPPDPMIARSFGNDIQSLTAEIEKEKSEYNQKSKHLQEQLSDLRTEIECLKVEGSQTEQDKIYAQNLQQGETKYSTLRKSGAGSPNARIQLFDGL